MIQANIIDQASGIQTQPTIDRSEATSPPSTSTAIIVGKFKRGIIGRPFVVTNTTYKAILGYDPMNPSYLAVEDAFNLGINKLSVLRTGGGKSITPSGESISYLNLNMPPELLAKPRPLK